MKLVLVALVCFVALWFVGHASSSAPFPRQIYVQNSSSTVSDAEVANALPAFQAATTLDFAPAWDASATLSFLPAGVDPPAGAWTILVQDPASIFYLGYHDLADGVPYAVVYTTDEWQVTFTHELFEVLGNPYLNRAARVQRRLFPFYIQETADPVEAGEFAYSRPAGDGASIAISDFVLPAWFRSGSRGPWDFAGHTRKPLQILRSGYQIAWSDQRSSWVELCFRNLVCAP